MTVKLVIDGKTYDELMKLFDNSIDALEKSLTDFSFDKVPKTLDKTIEFIDKIVKNSKKRKTKCGSSECDKFCCNDGFCSDCCKEDERTEWFDPVSDDDFGEECTEYYGVSDIDHIS